MFALIDCNNFYASCERVFRPDLVGKPIAVLSNNDGCVIARSNEAKAVGIPMGAPAYKYEKEFKEKGVHVFSSNYALYGDMSKRVMQVLATFAPEIEVYSIDEAFLKFEGCDYITWASYAEEIRKKVTQFTGIPVSVGFAPTKALAKVANRVAKKFVEKTGGSYVIDSDEKRIKALKWLKVNDVWGIGSRQALRLNSHGVQTAYEFVQQSDEWVRKNMSVVGLRLKHDLQGILTLDLEKHKVKQNIATTRSFEKNYTAYHDLSERISTFASSCAEKLRAQQSNCSVLLVFVNTNKHRQDLKQYKQQVVVKLPFPSNSSIELSKYAEYGLSLIFKGGLQYKKAGVVVMDITPESEAQLNLFEKSNERHKALMKAMDSLNKQMGSQKVKLANQDLNRTWKMKQERLSPRYTTKITDVLKVKA